MSETIVHSTIITMRQLSFASPEYASEKEAHTPGYFGPK